jgi:uncharacterized radical SAM superfamily Fe-S cluster-containing enzyme
MRQANNSERILAQTESVCPHCLKKLTAYKILRGDEVYLSKSCEQHGEFKTVVWRGRPAYESWTRPKIPTQPKVCYTEVSEGCPFDCGLCAAHRQHTCTALLEVTARCNLKCPVCFAASSPLSDSADPGLEVIEGWYEKVIRASGYCNIQLSGGEPTVREDLPEIIAMGRKMGFSFIQLNTNGIRLAQPGYAEQLRKAGLSSVFLQFDGTEDAIYTSIRGRPLLNEKLAAIEWCAQNGIGVVLVPTLVPGVNVQNIGEILRLAAGMPPVVRGVHFQPVSYFGRYPEAPVDESRVTLPEVMREIEKQTGGMIKAANLKPPGCENALCSFHGSFIKMPGGVLRAFSGRQQGSCCGSKGAEKAEEGARRAVSFVAKQWAGPVIKTDSWQGGIKGLNKGLNHAADNGEANRRFNKAVPGENIGSAIENDEISFDLHDFLDYARTNSFSVSAMAFQDAWNLDLERLKDCCIHVVAPDGRLIPFCAYNLTNCHGEGLYR